MASIADLILEQGRIAADRRAQLGNVYGHLAEQLGSLPDEARRETLQRQEAQSILAQRAQQGQLTGLNIAAAKTSAANQTALGQIWGDPSIYNPDGSINRPSVMKKVSTAAPALLPTVTDTLDKLDASQEAIAQKAAALQTAHDDTLGTASRQLEAAQNDPGTFHLIVSALARPGQFGTAPTISAEDANRYLQAQTPEDIKAIADQWRVRSPKASAEYAAAHKPITVPEGATVIDPAAATAPGVPTGPMTSDGRPVKNAPPGVLFQGAPKPKDYQAKSVLLDGKPAEVRFDPRTGQYQDASGADVSTRVKPIPSNATVNVTQGQSDAKAIADAIMRGEQPPDVKGLYRNSGPVRAELAKQGYDLMKANLDWQATQKHVASLNGAQQLRLNQSVNALPDMLDSVDALASQWKGGRFPLLNAANLKLAKEGAYGSDVASVANRLDAQIADVTADLGNVYMGGNSPTDHALGLAGKSLQGAWDEKVLHDMVALARKNVAIRRNSITSTGVAGLSTEPAPASAAPPASAVEEWVRDKNGKLVKKGGA
jgi:hypothetical protein